jgi:protein TonB
VPPFVKKFRPILIFVSCALIFGALVHADDTTGRKLKTRVQPQYPELARRMNVTGSVRLEVMIAANGQVKSVKPIGGHPLLIDAAESAVRQWRFEPGPENVEIVEIRFNGSGN